MRMTRCPIDRSIVFDDDGELKCIAAGHGPTQWASIGVEASPRPVSAPQPPKRCPKHGRPKTAGRDGVLYCQRCRSEAGGGKPDSVAWRGPMMPQRDKQDYLRVY